MERRTNFPSITVKQAFVQFLEGSSFARQTRESYAEDLRPLLTQVGQAPISALTDDVVRSYLRTQEALAPAMSNRHLAVFRSFSGFLSGRGWLTQAILEGVERKSEGTPATRAPNPLTYEVAIPTQRKLLRRRAKLKLSMQLREFPRANGPNLHEWSCSRGAPASMKMLYTTLQAAVNI